MEIVESGCDVGELSKFEKAVEVMDGIETVPAVAQRLLSLTSDPNASFEEIEKLIAADAGLTARILRVAASAFYGGRPAKNVQSAVVRLGLNELRKLAVSASLMARPPDAFHRNLWQFTLASAVLAEALSKRLGKQRFCEPFVCALLQELGTLVMAKIDGAVYQAVACEAGDPAQTERERAIYGFTHCDIGAMAAERWKLFVGLEQVIQFHHDPLAADLLDFPEPVLSTIQLVALASSVVRERGGDIPGGPAGELMTRLGTGEATVREELDRAQSQLNDYLALLA